VNRCSLNGCVSPHTPATCPVVGATANNVRKLQKAWDFWFPKRQMDPLSPRDTMQDTAERFCERIAPKLYEAKERLNALLRVD